MGDIKPNKEKKVKTVKTYSITVIEYEDGSSSMHRVCDGFNPLELLGMLSKTSMDVNRQIEGLIKPDVIKRTVITD